MMNVITIFVLLAHLTTNILGSPYHLMHKREKFCGPKLTEMMTLVCGGIYNSPQKKSPFDLFSGYADYYENNESSENMIPDEEPDFPFVRKALAKSLLSNQKRDGGIVNECCEKSCTLKEMRMYCGR
ncbi:LIRP-like [Cylas formicarius]|uniref:LIRP-like n=1 Tax=Cylas formicarius TaxID=197179 RepID=UPI0029588046|nr:LIRP-like [Cylas formicarius]